MSLPKKDHYFPRQISDAIVAEYVSAALRQEHSDISAALKHIERITGIPATTARKWYKGKYAPKSRYLLSLAMHYPDVLQAICELMGFGDLWREVIRPRVEDDMRARLDAKRGKWKKTSSVTDKFVLICVRVDARTAVQLNQRQLWFLGQLQQGYKMRAKDLVNTWRVHAKTAGRDVKGLQEAGLIHAFKRCKKSGGMNSYKGRREA